MIEKTKNFLTIYFPSTPYVFVYMIQQVEYNPADFLSWVNKLPNYSKIIKRKKLAYTKKASMLLIFGYMVWLLGFSSAVLIAAKINLYAGVLLAVWIPLILIVLLALLLFVSAKILNTKRKSDLSAAVSALKNHKAIKIVVIGSYGKTTTKELLASILSSGKNVAVTPGNKNVAISHARWINNDLKGNEDILIFELGEYRPGDIGQMAQMISPDYAIITGYAPNHLDTYKTEANLKEDLSSINKFVKRDNLFVSEQANSHLKLEGQVYSKEDILGWKLKIIENSLEGLKIELFNNGRKIKASSKLVGRHLAEPLALAIAVALKLDLREQDVINGAAATSPFDHRLKPQLVNDAWLIDDTYNGNIEGVKAGLTLLKELKGKRKIYVTPGLVEQGDKKQEIHEQIAKEIIKTDPDEVVLMKNSATAIIEQKLNQEKFKNKITLIDDPLSYYQDLQYHVAHGDIVLMQNDWTDNYN